MSGQVGVTFSADDQEVLNTFDKMNAKAENLYQKMRKLGKEGQEGGARTNREFSRGVQIFGQLATSIVGIGSVVEGLRKAIDIARNAVRDIQEQQKAAQTTQLEFAPALANAYRNSNEFFGDMQAFEKRFSAFAKTLPFAKRTGLANAYGATLSSIGPTNLKEAELAETSVKAAYEYLPLQNDESKAQLAAVSGALSKRFGWTPQQSIGAIQATGNLSNIADPKFLTKNAGPALVGLTDYGFKIDEAASIYATLTQGANDKEGDVSRNASLNFGRRLREFRRKLDIEKTESAGQTLERMQQNPKLRKLFLEGGKARGIVDAQTGRRGMVSFAPYSGEVAVMPTIESMLGAGDAVSAKQYQAGKKQIGKPADFQKLYAANQAKIYQSGVVQNAMWKKGFDVIAEDQDLLNVDGGLAATTREGLDKLLAKGGTEKQVREVILGKLRFDKRGRLNEVPQDAIDVLQKRSTNIRAFHNPIPGAQEAAEAEAKKNDQVVAGLNLIKDTIARQTKVMEEQHREVKHAAPPPAPGKVPAAGLNGNLGNR